MTNRTEEPQEQLLTHEQEQIQNEQIKKARLDTLSKRISSMLIKSAVAAIVCYWLYSAGADEESLDVTVSLLFLCFTLFYAVGSFYGVCLAITKNYIIALIVMFAIIFASMSFVDRIEAAINDVLPFADWLVGSIFLFPFFYDVYRIVRLAKVKKSSP